MLRLRPRLSFKRTLLFDSFVILLLAAILVWPLFHLEYLGIWSSIESTFISDARILANHLPHPGWQPLWYCGTRFDYIYPPALRYGTALLSIAGHISTARAYHLYTGSLYVVGIVAVYWLVRVGNASRKAALLATAATALLSPSFLFLPLFRHDSAYLVPQRLHVLMAYGEGPHISALSILPAALAASFLALRGRRLAWLALAAALCAFDVANNFYGATALAIFFPVLVWSVWLGERSWRVVLRACGIAGLAYGLSAFWLTPSFLKITVANLKWVAQPGNTWSVFVAAIVTVLFCVGSFRLANRRPDREWPVFVTGLAIFLSLNVLGYFYFGFHVSGDSQRLVPEFDLAIILAFAEVMRALSVRPRLRVAAVLLISVAFLPAAQYLSHPWFPFPASEPLKDRYEFRIAQWVRENLPGERVLPSGSARFWFDAWSDNAQPDGGSMQGMLNQNIPTASWQILKEHDAALAVLWLQALGTDAVIVPDGHALDAYHDYNDPHKFRGAVASLYDDHAGTAIYRIPRVRPGIGRVVDKRAIGSVGKLRGGDDAEALTRYVAAVEKPDQAATTVVWTGFDNVGVQATLADGQSVLLQETWDPSWRAEENGAPLAIRPEPVMGFMLIDAPAGPHNIRLRFETPLENRAGQILFALSSLTMLALVFARGSSPAGTDVGHPRDKVGRQMLERSGEQSSENVRLWGKQLAKSGWWHSFELPDGRRIEGANSLEGLKRRLDGFPVAKDLTGKRVLDIGAWDGWFSFEMERRGAEVVSIDCVASKNFLYLHKELGSKIDYRLLDVYDLTPRKLGQFDIVLFLGVLYHLKHPLLGLEKVCALTRDVAIVQTYTSPDPGPPAMEFYETGELGGQFDNWVGPNVNCVLSLCRTAGFARVELLSVHERNAAVACYRHFETPAAVQGAPVRLQDAVNMVTFGINFDSNRDDYVTCWFHDAGQNLNCDSVQARVGEFDSRPVYVAPSEGLWQVNFKLPPGLAPGWQEVRVRTTTTGWSEPRKIALDIPLVANSIAIAGACDGKTWTPFEVTRGREAVISVWITGAPENTGRNDVSIALGDHVPDVFYIATWEREKPLQVNVHVPEGLSAGEYPLVARIGSASSDRVSIQVR